ncbi:MAG: DUF418 domain-containing protein [Acidobacteria bacterium]|nr:DUF418 domain-containing protein [Acidobacteriota bacterium]
MTQLTQLPPRAVMPDLLRAFALFGIAVVNVVGFAQPFTAGFHGGGLATPADKIAYGAMTSLFLMKSYPLFSMMFGAGLGYQMAASVRAGARFAPRYFRRMTALMVLGLLHFVFFWIGDILFTYGLLGCLLYALRGASVRLLVRTGIALIALNTALLIGLAGMMWLAERYAPEDLAGYARMEASAIAAFADGSFVDAVLYRLSLAPTLVPSVVAQQGLSVFGFSCFGLAMVKSGVIDQPEAAVWRLSRRVLLPVGLAGSGIGSAILIQAASSVDSAFILGSAVILGFAGFAAMGYAGLIALVCRGGGGPVRNFIALAGSASLTAYLLQSVLFSLLFADYGADLFGKLGAASAIALAAGVAGLSLLITGIWRHFAPRGPMEVFLRRVTYWGRA